MGFGDFVKAALPAVANAFLPGSGELVAGFVGAKDRNREAQAAAAQQMGFQKWMYSNRYQMQMADMRAAGLNPILSYRNAPPGVPAGSTYNPIDAVGAASQTSSALSTARLNRKNVEMVDANVGLAKTNTALAAAQVQNTAQDTAVKRAEEILRGTNITRQSIENSILVEELARMRAGAASARHTERIYETPYAGALLRWMDEIGRSVNPFASAASEAGRASRGGRGR